MNLNVNLSFLRFFKKVRPADSAAAVVSQPIVAIEKPASERFGKTVMPNVTRIVGVESSVDFNPPVGAGVSLAAPSVATALLSGVGSSLTTGGPGLSSAALIPSAVRKISLGGGSLSPGPKRLVPELASPERTIALQLADVAPGIPDALLKPEPIDPLHRLILKASDLERGMASGRPTVPLYAIYQQVPEFFSKHVDVADKTEVAIPFAKALEQFAALQVRPDQVVEQALPQVETPFLQVTQEDSKRFGTPATPVSAPVSAPEPTLTPVTETQPEAPIRLSLPKEADDTTGSPAPIQSEKPPAHPPIAAKVSPNGTGAPASERVPASSGSPVPTPLPSLLAPATPARIPLKISPPSNDLREAALPKVQSLHAQIGQVEFSAPGSHIRLPLRTILREVAPLQLSGPIDDVAEDAMIELPFSIVEPQLSLGRIAISPAQFQAALPEEYRAIFKIEDPETPIALPLRDVLQNLPNEILQLRDDQEAPEVVSLFETPFSQKAAEDATRLKSSPAPIAKPAVTSDAVKPAAVPVPPTKVALAPASTVRTAFQVIFDTDEALDAKGVVARVSRLSGVSACAIVCSDGLSLAGDIPSDYGVDALCAIAPSILKKIGEQMGGTNLGSLAGVTLFCAKSAVTFFGHEDICLTTLHKAGEELAPEIRGQLNRVAEELARAYAQPR
jgi:predicted regulator of Ras-like GTPase activity (Roadblock/LC7/MglB family)